MRRDFLYQYSLRVNCPKSVLQHIYQMLISDCSAPSNESEREVDERAREALELDDPEIVYDPRKLNSNVKSSK